MRAWSGAPVMDKWIRYGVGFALRTALMAALCVAGFPGVARAGHMFLEHKGELLSGYTFYRGVLDLGDLDRDGADEMVIADDRGGYHVYHFSPGGFVPMWVSDPIIQTGHIVDVKIMYEEFPGVMPHVLLLDSNGTLHEFRYTGYLFEETAVYEEYSPPGESGRLVVTDIGEGERAVLIALPKTEDGKEEGESEEAVEEGAEGSNPDESDDWGAMIFYRLTSDGLVELAQEEIGQLEEGQVYFVQELTTTDVKELESLGSETASMFSGSDEGRTGLADLDRDALLELLVAVSDPERPIDRLEIYKEEGDTYTVRITLELPLINEMLLGDVDADGFTEIVGLTYEGVVIVYQWDPLTVRLPDGVEIDWEAPHKQINDMIWMSLGGFESLGCLVEEEPDGLHVIRGDRVVRLDRVERSVMCGEEVLLPEVPDEILEAIPYLPLFSSLDCLGFLYTYDASEHLVEVELAE